MQTSQLWHGEGGTVSEGMLPVLVIGGSPGGLEAARSTAALGVPVLLVERRARLGGTPDLEQYAKLTHGFRDAETALAELIQGVESTPGIQVFTRSEVTSCEGEVGNFTVTVQTPKGVQQHQVGAIIVATGFQHFDPGRETQLYNYYSFPDVVTLSDMEAMLKAHQVVRPSNGQPPERVAFIQCVGSRDRQIGNEFCSKVCCGIASKLEIK